MTKRERSPSDDASEERARRPLPAVESPTPPERIVIAEGEPGSLTGRPLRLYADGIFDLFHLGHARALRQCKLAYPNVYLLVGCCNDTLTHELKGRTVMTEEERYESLRHCKWVDTVVEDAPWVLSDEFLDSHKIDFVCHDALPYGDTSGESGDDGDVYARIKAMGKFHETTRTEGISTSDLIIRIISQYDMFIRRNLSRGYTGKQMNVPFMKEQSIKLDMAVEKLTTKTKDVKHNMDSFIHRWVEKAEEMQGSFIDLFFNPQGPVRTSLRKRRRVIKDKFQDFAREGAC